MSVKIANIMQSKTKFISLIHSSSKIWRKKIHRENIHQKLNSKFQSFQPDEDFLVPSNVKSTSYKSGRRSLKTPQLCLWPLIISKLNSAVKTASSLSFASAMISPVGPNFQFNLKTIIINNFLMKIKWWGIPREYLLWMNFHRILLCYHHVLFELFPCLFY